MNQNDHETTPGVIPPAVVHELARMYAEDREAAHRAVDLMVSADTAQRMQRGVAESTRRAYRHDRKAYAEWCAATGRVRLPATPQTLAEYVAHLAGIGRSPKSIERALGAIRTEHRTAGHVPPDSKGATLVLRDHRRARAAAGIRDRKATPLMIDMLRRLVEVCDAQTPAGTRDRALIVLGFMMMSRRSDLVGLDVADVDETPEGLNVLIRWSKTDQDAVGHVVAIPYGSHPETCPVRLLRAWRELLATRGLTAGPLLRAIDRHGRIFGEPKYAGRAAAERMSGESVGIVLQRAARKAGISTEALTAHSLRAGGATEAYRSGADALSIARHGRWKDGSPVLLGYIRSVDRWRENPMRGIGL